MSQLISTEYQRYFFAMAVLTYLRLHQRYFFAMAVLTYLRLHRGGQELLFVKNKPIISNECIQINN